MKTAILAVFLIVATMGVSITVYRAITHVSRSFHAVVSGVAR